MDPASPELRAVMMTSTAPLIEEAAEIVARVKQDIERYKEIKTRLDGAAVFLGENPFVLPPPSWITESGASPSYPKVPVSSSGRPPSWKEFALNVLEGTTRGYSNLEMMQRAAEIGLGEFEQRYRASPNGFLQAIRVLEAEGHMVRRKGANYLPAVWQRIESGELTDAREKAVGGLAGHVLQLIEQDGPMTAGEIIAAFKRRPELREIGEKRSSSIYTTLGKLHPKGRLVKDGSIYRLPTQATPAAENVTLFPKPTGGGGV